MNQSTKTLALVPAQPMAVDKPQPTPAEILQAVVEKGITADSALAVKEIAALVIQMEERAALKQYASAFKKMQSELPHIEVNKSVPTKGGGVKFKYCTPEEIMIKAEKALSDNGFSVKFSQRLGDASVTAICTLIHEGGHREVNEYSTRSAAPYDGSVRDADVASSTVAQREALCDALHIIRTHPELDPRMKGPPITKQQAADLERRVNETGSDIKLFLKFAGAESFETISSTKYDMLDENLRKKEKTT